MDETLNIFGVGYGMKAFSHLVEAVDFKILWYEAEIIMEKSSLLGLLAQL